MPKEYIERENAYDYGTLEDWFINSVSDTDSPIWTKEYLKELINDFYVIPKDTPKVDVAEVKHGKWIKAGCSEKYGNANCSECGYWDWSDCNYCPECGAKMDKEWARMIRTNEDHDT